MYTSFLEKTKKIKLLISDLDGTLLTEKGTLSEETKKNIEKLRAQGIEFAIATGRVEAMAMLFQKQLSLRLPMISCNGAMVAEPFTKELISLQALPLEQVLQLYDLYMERDLDFLIYTNKGIFYREGSKRMQMVNYYRSLCEAVGEQYLTVQSFENLGSKEKLREILSQEGTYLLKIFVRHDDHHYLKSCFEETKKVKGIQAVVSWSGSFDVMAEGVSKGEAVKKLASHYGFSLEEVACFGDHDNDEEMLQVAGLSYAPKNALPSLKKMVDKICESNKINGVSMAIEQDFLKKV